MNILIKNANLISMSNKRNKYEENIDILIKDEKIFKIGNNLQTNEKAKVIDAKGKIVLPGLINTHAHVSMSIFRETLDGYNLQEWLENKIWPMEDKLKPKDIYYAAYLSFIEMIRTGCTTINDMYFMPEDSIRAAIEIGIRLQTTRTLVSSTEGFNNRLKELKRLIHAYKDNPNISLNMGIHGLYTTKEDDLAEFLKFAKEANLRVHMHFCENSKEVEDINHKYNVVSPVKLIEKYFKEIPLLLAHAVKLTDQEIVNLGNLKNISISHCPISNLKLGCGIAKIQKMLDEKINVSLGTDGQGSGSNLDMFETMKFTALLQKGINENPKNLSAYEVLKMATINGAKALGLENEIGSLEENKKADLIIIDMNEEYIQPINDIFASVVYNVKGSNVDTTIINGQVLMESKKLICIKTEEIYKECKKIIERIKSK